MALAFVRTFWFEIVIAAVTLCVPPRPGELCAPVRFLLRQDG